MKRILALISAAILTLPLVWSCTEEQETQNVKVQSISIAQGDLTLEEGESVNLTATVLPEDATDKTVSWSSSNDEIVMVSSNGKAKAMAIGEAIITAQSGDKGDFITITVVAKTIPVTGLSLNPSSITLKVGESQTITADVTPQDATDKNVTWESSNPEVASVNNGTVTGLNPGSVTITAMTVNGGKTAECSVTVKANLAPSVTIGSDHISAVSAVLSGEANLETSGSSDLTMGIMLSMNSGVLPSNSTKIEAKQIEAKEGFEASYSYNVDATGLEPETTYYYRSYVTQNGQDTYGETKSFSTKELLSLIHTLDASTISSVSAKLNAELNLTDVKYSSKTFGFYWGTSYESLDSKVIAAEGDGIISADLYVLNPSILYYYQAFASFDGKELKEEIKSFTTKDIASLFETKEASGIEATKAVLSASIDLTDVKYDSISYGFYWGTSESSQPTFVKGGEIASKSFSASLTSLSHQTQYWFKAYVKLDSQSFYGEVKSFTTDVVHVESVTLDITEHTFNTIGKTLPLTATVLPDDATDKSVEWSSSNEDVAVVDAKGKVTAKGTGAATITVTTKDQGKTASCAITVAQLVTDISLNKTILTLNEGREQMLIPTISPSNASDKSLNWTSSNEAAATVDQTGKVTAVSKGTATIKATANDGSGKYATCSVIVKRPVTSVQLNKHLLVLYRGESDVSETLIATVVPSDASNTAVTWSSSYPSVATVSSSGVVTSKSKGTTYITVSAVDGYASATCKVEVMQYVTRINLDNTSLDMIIGDTWSLVATVGPDNANDKTLSWSSSNEAVVSVDGNGVVSALSKGKASITASAKDGSGVNATCSVVVSPKCPTGAVDMGTTTADGYKLYWGTSNLGAGKPEEYGDYYAWGEVDPYYSSQDPLTWKDGKTGYNWASYKWCNGSSYTLTKYNTNSSCGTVDNKTVLDPEDDVAHVKLGGKWRMPTDEEWEELRTKCTWTWTTNYNGTGVKGQIVTATNGNSIFLPAAGNRDDTALSGAGSYGYYWSPSLTTDYQGCAWTVYFYSDNVYRFYGIRCNGQSVRPVSE